MLIYLYYRQAPVEVRTLALVGGPPYNSVHAYMDTFLDTGAVDAPRYGWFVIGAVTGKEAALVRRAIRPCPVPAGGLTR
jgi:hypothetical protein